MSAQVRPPPGEPPVRSRSKNAISNPRYKAESGRGTESDRSTVTPVEEIFPRKRKVSRNLINGRNRNTRAAGKEPREGDVDKDSKSSQKNPVFRAPTPPREDHPRLRAPIASFDKLRGSVQKGSTSFAKAFFGDSDSEDSEFDPDDIEDIDYEQKILDIEKLPFWERIWAKKIPGRLAIALTAVALIWLTSFGLIRLIITSLVFPAPTLTQISNDGSDYFQFVDSLRDGYAGCANQEFLRCQSIFDTEVDREISRTDNVLAANDQFLLEFEGNRSRSKELLNNTLQDFVAFVQDGQNLAGFSSGGNLDECPRVRQLLVNSLAANSALSRQINVDELTNEALNDIAENFRIQQEFSDNFWAQKDAELFDLNTELSDLYNQRAPEINFKLDDSFTNFADCFTTDLCGGQEGLQGLLNRINQTLEDDADNKNTTFFVANSDVERFLTVYNRLLDVAVGLNEVFPIPLDNTPPVSVQTDVDFDSFLDNNNAVERLNNGLDDVFDPFDQAIDDVQQKTADAATDFANEASSFNRDGIEFYDPPTLDPTLADQYRQDQANRNAELANSLVEAGNDQSNEDEFFEPSQKQADPTEFVDNIVSSFPDRDLDFFAYDASVFRSIELGIDNFIVSAILIDVMVRILLSISKFNKYWKLSKLGKPPGDVRVKELIGQHFGVKKTSQQKMIDRLTHPAVLNGLTMLFVILMITVVYAMYRPFFLAYIEGCRENDLEDIRNNESDVDGTMIFNNVVAASLTYAAQSGDAVVTTSVDILNNQREVECEANTIRTVDTSEDQLELYNAIRSDYENTLSFRNEIVFCMNLASFDLNRGTNTEEEMNDSSFNFSFQTELQNGVFDCGVLSLCDISATCNFGEREERLVEDEAFVFACDAEQFIHGTVLSSLLIFLIYVTMFIFRKNFMRALIRVFWREINPYDFNIYATCLRDGTHVDPERVTESGFTFQDTVTLELHKAIRKWENESWKYLIAALSLHIPWLFGAIFLRAGFHY